MAAIQERKNADGTTGFTATIRRRGFPTLCRTFSTRTAAKMWALQEEAKIQRGAIEVVQAQKITLSEAIDAYCARNVVHPNRILHLERWRRALGVRLLSQVTAKVIREVVDEWRTLGIEGEKVEGATINRHLNGLSLVFRFAVTMEWTSINPVSAVKKLADSPVRVRYLSDEEYERLMEACKNSPYRPLRLIVLLALTTAMRRDEIRFLTWTQIDIRTGEIHLTRTKNKRQRMVYAQGEVLELLREQFKVRALRSSFVFPAVKQSSTVAKISSSPNDRPFDFRRAWERARREAGLTGGEKQISFRLHDCKHTCLSRLAMEGANQFELMAVGGHTRLESTMRYVHLANQHVKKLTQTITARMLRGKV